MEAQEYREAYERERLKSAQLASRIAQLEVQKEELEWQLNHIRENPLWKASRPLRRGVHWIVRQKDRLSRCGSVKEVFGKVGYQLRQRRARKRFGTASFPDAEEAARQRQSVFPRMVTFSILAPLYNTPEPFLRESIQSVLNQTYEKWELCLADGSDREHAYVEAICKEYLEKSGGRIRYQKLLRNGGISANTNEALKMARGEYIGLFDHDDILHPSALYEYAKAVNEQGADYLYCDETTFHKGDLNKMLTLHFKPDFAPDNLRANNYICHFSVFSRELLDDREVFRAKYDGSQDHDMILRLTARASRIVHIPRILYYWRSHSGSVASGIEAKTYAIEAAKGAVAESLRGQGFEHFRLSSTKAFETIFRIQYQVLGEPLVSIVIANQDHAEDLKRCVASILEKSTYSHYEILIVENNSTTAQIREYYASLQENEKIRILTYEGAFNYSAVNNLGVSEARGRYVLLLNNDTEVITANWMEELLMYAQREDVGAVGCKLYYADRTIQHAGVVIGLGAHRSAGHTHYRQHWKNLGYMGRLCYAQNVTAVTGACLMVKKQLYEEVGGLEEEFAVSLNDVDFCLKLRERKLLNVFTPFAELYHAESASRGSDGEGGNAARYGREAERFREKWKDVLEKGDPYYNPNFSLDRSDFSLKNAPCGVT